MGVYRVLASAGRKQGSFLVNIRRKGMRFDPAAHASFFIGFAGCSVRSSAVLSNLPFRESPSTRPGLHQQKLDLVLPNPITNRGNMCRLLNRLAFGIRSALEEFVQDRHDPYLPLVTVE
jgi:hypothetical protein